jgi:hypothetical protein
MVQVIHRAYAGTPGVDVVRNEAVLAEVRGDSTLEAHCTTATQSSHQQHHRHNIQTELETMVQ